MERLRVYVDTSVIGGYHDEEFAIASRRVIEAARSGRIILLSTEVVVQELRGAPDAVRAIVDGLPLGSVERVPMSDAVLSLRDAYLAAGILGPESLDDAAHVAAATVARADAICSWNFKHIVRLDKMKAYNEVNQSLGYGALVIVTPQEVRTDEPGESKEGL